MLRWHIDKGRSAIPKSVRPTRIAENFDVFEFELSREEVAAIDALDTGVRGGPDPDSISLEALRIPRHPTAYSSNIRPAAPRASDRLAVAV
jgi:hypothetical protein